MFLFTTVEPSSIRLGASIICDTKENVYENEQDDRFLGGYYLELV